MATSAARSAVLVFLLGSLALAAGLGDVSCITSYSSSTDYFPNGYTSSGPFSVPVDEPLAAQKFSVQYSNAYKLVYNTFSNTTYMLYQCGAPVSNGGYNASVKPIEIPVNAAAIDSTIQVGFFELLGLLPLLKGVSEEYTAAYVNSPCVQKLIQTKQIQALNSSSTDFADFSGIVFSSLQMQPEYDSNYVYFDASQDPGPLKRAEWIKYLAVFFNLEETATSVYNEIEANYQCLNGSSTLTTKPVVAWLNEYPKGVLTLDNATYKTQLTVDAGGKNLEDSVYGSYNLSVPGQRAAFRSILAGVDVVVDETYALVPSAYNMTTFLETLQIAASDSYPFVANKRVWREDRRLQKNSLGLDWYEGSIAQPQIVLQELLGILNPATNFTRHFFRNIAVAEQVVPLSAEDCQASDPLAALKPTIYTCPIKAGTASTSGTPASPPPASTAPRTSGSETRAPLSTAALLALVPSVLAAMGAL